MDFESHKYTHAIVGKVAVGASCTSDFIDVRRQHDCYLRILRELEVEVIELDLGSKFPGNVVIEDLAIVNHGIALLMKPSSSDVEQQLRAIKDVLQNKLGHTVIDLKDPDAKLKGSDVLFTGKEFFVGMCETSNEAGASAVAEAFPEFPCTPIKISSSGKHLKKYISVAGSDVLCVSSSKEAQELIKRMEREATFSYQTLTVPEDEAANCLYVNGTLLHRAIEEIPDSFKVFCEKIDFARRSICFHELSKVSCGLSSCCILAKKL